MKRLITFLLFLTSFAVSAKVSVTDLRVENLVEPLAIGTDRPHFSWRLTADAGERNVLQTAYELVISSNGRELWHSGRVESDRQLWLSYEGPALRSTQHLEWQVRVYTTHGATDWSPLAHFGVGLLSESHWRGRWIGLESMQTDEYAGMLSRLAARYLRKTFVLAQKPVRRATAYIAGLGLYRLYINGREVGADEVLKPVPSDYRKTIYYNAYDVTPLLSDTTCRVMIVLGNGKYFAPRQNKPYKNTTFGLPKCRMNIIVEYADGKTQRLQTDETWQVSADGPIRANNEYDGEEYDARCLPADWRPAERTAIPEGMLCAQPMPSMTMGEPIVPVAQNQHIYDFGQNMAGWVSFEPKGRDGDTIRIRYAERLDSTGRLYTANLRHARSTDIYVCGTSPTSHPSTLTSPDWHPSFVYHGFRYVEITGAPVEQVRAHVVSDVMTPIGQLECSDTTINQVLRNARWGILSNYKGLPVDCPQRDERQPWLGDRTVGSLGESYLFDNERLYAKWMRDICEAQRSDGCIPDVAPAFWNYYSDDVTWPACLPFTCDMLWQQYGNEEVVRQCYPAMKRWVEHMMAEYQRDGLVQRDKYGDWCMPPERLEFIHAKDSALQTDGALISAAYMIRVLQLMCRFTTIEGVPHDDWQATLQPMVQHFNRRFLTVRRRTSPVPGHPLYPDSIYYGNNTVTANLLPLAFGIVPDSLRQSVVDNIVRRLYENKWRLTTGVIGTSWLLRTLSDNGRGDVAMRLANQRAYPSWGYMVSQGATTIWELWNGDKADPRMNSANHVMLLGDFVTWCYQYLGGIRSTSAYKHIDLQPDFALQELSWVNMSYTTPYGTVVSRWRRTSQHLHWEVEVPCGTTATLHLPDGTRREVGSGSYTLDVDIPTRDTHIVTDEFVYAQDGPFPSVHATTIVERKNGDLVCAYFGGSYEGCPDVRIWTSIKKKEADTWSAPVLAGESLPGKACNNPVLMEMPGGELWLFYKIGANVKDWTGWLTTSRDGGRTWSKKKPLPDGFLGPVKNKPLLLGDRLICGSSTEKDGWKFHVEIYDLKSREWKYIGPVEAELAYRTKDLLLSEAGGGKPHPIDCIQPSILQLNDGRLMVLMRTQNGRLARSYSSDGGETWTNVELTNLPNNQSGTDAVTLRDGRHVLVYNDFATLPGERKGPRTPLCVAVSDDDGLTWSRVCTLEDSPISEYSYPAVIEGRDGFLHITYTWRRQRVAYKKVKLSR